MPRPSLWQPTSITQPYVTKGPDSNQSYRLHRARSLASPFRRLTVREIAAERHVAVGRKLLGLRCLLRRHSLELFNTGRQRLPGHPGPRPRLHPWRL